MFNPYFEQSSIQWNKAITGSCSRHPAPSLNLINQGNMYVRTFNFSVH